MHNLQNRANFVFSTFVTAMFGVLGAIALSGMFYLALAPAPESSLAVQKVETKIGRLGHYYDYGSSTEFAGIHFDLDADLSPLFNWNTKLLFVYVTASYTKPRYPTNQAIVWDDIIHTKEDASIALKNQRPKYLFTDLADKFGKVQANLTLHWNLVPWVGMFNWDEHRAGSIQLSLAKPASRNS